MREGKASIHFNTFYGYERGEDGKPQIIEEQAEVVRGIFDRFLSGQSLCLIKEWLEGEGILTAAGKSEWTAGTIRNILTNEKYCGDVLMQKTFVADCIEKKTVRNIGQLPMYLIQDNHEGIITRETFHAEYYGWLEPATKARDDYLAGKLTAEQALAVIEAEPVREAAQ